MASLGHLREDRFQPPAALLNRTAAKGFSYLDPKPAAVRNLSHGNGYNSLPRQKPHTGGPATLSHARRKIVNSALQDYLKSLNSMTRSIVLETETVEKENKYNWTKLDVAKKEDLVNDHFVPEEVRIQYNSSERSASCCGFSAPRLSLERNQDVAAGYREGVVMENKPLHLSQPDDWEELSSGKEQLSRSSRDLVFRNEWSSTTASQREDLSLSQPSITNSFQEPVEKASFNRLHKQQLSFRPSHKHAVKPRQLPTPQQQSCSSFRSQLGSDGETSDEDFEGFGVQAQNALGFQRSKLRSYSMRSKKGNGSLRNSANLRSSVRTSNRVRSSDREETTPYQANAYPQLCRPSHSHTYSSTSTETDFDEAIDMPDDALLLDHVSRKSSTEENMFSDDYQKILSRHSRMRRSMRGTPKITLEQSEVHINHSLCSEATQSTSSFSSSDAYLVTDTSTREAPEFYRPPSRDSLDFDSVSIAPSDASKYPMDDEEDQSRMTPDSVLSLSSSYSCRPRSKNSELAVLRNRRGNRGGSYIKVATSDFADRHMQFKNNTSPSYPTSACTTRATSPASSVASSVAVHWPTHEQDSTGHLKAPSFSYSIAKHDSAAESTAPCSPDHSSILSSPPNTPLAVNYTANAPMLRKTLSHYEDRESGYISSSLESFPVTSRQ